MEVATLHAAEQRTAHPGSARLSGIVLGAGVGMVFGFSAAYISTLSVLLKPIAASFGWSRAQTSAVAMLAQLGLAVGAPLLGGLIGRHGAHRVIPVSILLFAAGLFALSHSPNSLTAFGACSFLLGFAAVGTTPAGYLTALPAVFDKRLGLAMGLAMLGLGLGNTGMPMVTQSWVTASGWQGAYRLLALAVLLGGAVAVALLFGPTYLRGERLSRTAGSAAASLPGDDLSSALRTWRFWLIAGVLFAVSAAVIGAAVHLVPALTDRGMAAQQAAQMAALTGIGLMVGRVGAGALLDVFDARYIAAAAFATGAAGLALVAAGAASTGMVSLSAFLFASAVGAEGDFIPFFARRYFGLRQFSQLYGVLFAFFAVGGVVGPILFGIGFDQLGDYTAVFWAASATCAACAALVLALGQYAYPAEER